MALKKEIVLENGLKADYIKVTGYRYDRVKKELIFDLSLTAGKEHEIPIRRIASFHVKCQESELGSDATKFCYEWIKEQLAKGEPPKLAKQFSLVDYNKLKDCVDF